MPSTYLKPHDAQLAASSSKSSKSLSSREANPSTNTNSRSRNSTITSESNTDTQTSNLTFVREDGLINKYTQKRPHPQPKEKNDERAKRPEVPGVPREFTSVLDQTYLSQRERARPMDPMSKVVKMTPKNAVAIQSRARTSVAVPTNGTRKIAGGDVEVLERFVPSRTRSDVAEWHVPQPGTTQQLETMAHLDQGSPASPYFDSLQYQDGVRDVAMTAHEQHRVRRAPHGIQYASLGYAPPPGPPPGYPHGNATSIPAVQIHPAVTIGANNGNGYGGLYVQDLNSPQLQQQLECQTGLSDVLEVMKCRCGKMYECGTGREIRVRGELQTLCASCPSPFSVDSNSPAFSDFHGDFQFGGNLADAIDPTVIQDFSFIDADRLIPTVTSQSGSLLANGHWTPGSPMINDPFGTQPMAGLI